MGWEHNPSPDVTNTQRSHKEIEPGKEYWGDDIQVPVTENEPPCVRRQDHNRNNHIDGNKENA